MTKDFWPLSSVGPIRPKGMDPVTARREVNGEGGNPMPGARVYYGRIRPPGCTRKRDYPKVKG